MLGSFDVRLSSSVPSRCGTAITAWFLTSADVGYSGFRGSMALAPQEVLDRWGSI